MSASDSDVVEDEAMTALAAERMGSLDEDDDDDVQEVSSDDSSESEDEEDETLNVSGSSGKMQP